MKRLDTIVDNPVDDAEIAGAKDVYVDVEEQPVTYGAAVPDYAKFVSGVIASLKPRRVLEFGCNGGRNLDLIRAVHADASYQGVDVNPMNVKRGRDLFGLDLVVGDENWLKSQKTDAVDVAFTVSVIDHIPFPEESLRQLIRISSEYLVLFELAHDRIGRATHNLRYDETTAELAPVYRYSYIHDYRYECERKFGCTCVADVRFPIGSEYLWDLYRLYVFTKRKDTYAVPAINTLAMRPIQR
jgi:SAM-dependent methyltransferase